MNNLYFYNFSQKSFFNIIFCLFIISFVSANIKIPIYDIDGAKYISASEYITYRNSSSKFNDQKKKLEFKFEYIYDIILSQNSSFIMINDGIYHLYLPVKMFGRARL